MSFTEGPISVDTALMTLSFAKPPGIVAGWVEIINMSPWVVRAGAGGSVTSITIPPWFYSFMVVNQSIQQVTLQGTDVVTWTGEPPSSVVYLNWLEYQEGPPYKGSITLPT